MSGEPAAAETLTMHADILRDVIAPGHPSVVEPVGHPAPAAPEALSPGEGSSASVLMSAPDLVRLAQTMDAAEPWQQRIATVYQRRQETPRGKASHPVRTHLLYGAVGIAVLNVLGGIVALATGQSLWGEQVMILTLLGLFFTSISVAAGAEIHEDHRQAARERERLWSDEALIPTYTLTTALSEDNTVQLVLHRAVADLRPGHILRDTIEEVGRVPLGTSNDVTDMVERDRDARKVLTDYIEQTQTELRVRYEDFCEERATMAGALQVLNAGN